MCVGASQLIDKKVIYLDRRLKLGDGLDPVTGIRVPQLKVRLRKGSVVNLADKHTRIILTLTF